VDFLQTPRQTNAGQSAICESKGFNAGNAFGDGDAGQIPTVRENPRTDLRDAGGQLDVTEVGTFLKTPALQNFQVGRQSNVSERSAPYKRGLFDLRNTVWNRDGFQPCIIRESSLTDACNGIWNRYRGYICQTTKRAFSNARDAGIDNDFRDFRSIVPPGCFHKWPQTGARVNIVTYRAGTGDRQNAGVAERPCRAITAVAKRFCANRNRYHTDKHANDT